MHQEDQVFSDEIFSDNIFLEEQPFHLKGIISEGLFGGIVAKGLPLRFINHKMLQLMGYGSREELCEVIDGMALNCVYPPDREHVETNTLTHFQNHDEDFIDTFRVLQKDGGYFWVRAINRMSVDNEGNPVIFSKLADITAEKELENQLNIYREASRGGTFKVEADDGLRLVYANDIFFKVHQFSADTLRDQLDNKCISLIYKEDLPMVMGMIQKAIQVGQESLQWEMRIVTGNGEIRWLQVSSTLESMEGRNYLQGFIVDVTEKYQMEETLRLTNEQYQIALMEAEIRVWNYSIADATLSCLQAAHALPGGLSAHYQNVPESIIQAGILDPESIGEYQSIFQRIAAGEKRFVCDLQLAANEGEFPLWERLIVTTVFGEDGKPVRAILVTEDITQQREAEIRYQQELQIRDTVTTGFLVGGRANLSKNIVEVIQREGNASPLLTTGMTYDEMFEMNLKEIANADDQELYRASFSRVAQLKAYSKGRSLISLDYRMKGADGKILWVNTTTRMVLDQNTRNILSYGSVRDISERKNTELALLHRAERDPLTGAYNKATMMDMVRNTIAQRAHTGYALLQLNVDRFQELIKVSGYKTADSVICALFDLLQTDIHGSKIIGRFFGDEMMVFLWDSPDREQICAEIDHIRKHLAVSSQIPAAGIPLTLSVGMVFCSDASLNEEQLLERAVDSVARCRASGGDCVFISENQERYFEQKHSLGLNRETGEIVTSCAFMLNSSQELDHAIQGVLGSVCTYYSADFAILAEQSLCSNKIEAVHCWQSQNSQEKQSIPHQKAAQCLQSLLADRSQVMVSDTARDNSALCEALQEKQLSGLYAARLETGGKLVGYLAVFNPKAHDEETLLLDALNSMLANAVNRRQLEQLLEHRTSYDADTNLLNRKSYREYLTRFNPDSTISLGAVSADINGLKQVNMKYGQAYGDGLVQFTASTLQRLFTHVFRLSGDEFVALSENLTFEAFQKQVSQFQKEAAVSYSDGIAFGSSWNDGEINPVLLVEQADERMVIEKRRQYRTGNVMSHHHDVQKESLIKSDIAAGRYEMFLQPQTAICDNSLAGAEALVRYRNEKGQLVFPDKFIPQLELDGNIHYIDLFIFEEVCRTLQRWIASGLEPIPISLNFSRVTLLEENLTDRMEEIYSRYQVPKSLIEIEVTESVGSVERESLIRISSCITENGYRLALDDFGSKYSNLSLLSVMKLNVLKLDKSLVNDLLSNENTRIVVKNFLATCRDLKIQSVAEGVETTTHLAELGLLGCDYAQGYCFNKPIPLKDFEALYILNPAYRNGKLILKPN